MDLMSNTGSCVVFSLVVVKLLVMRAVTAALYGVLKPLASYVGVPVPSPSPTANQRARPALSPAKRAFALSYAD